MRQRGRAGDAGAIRVDGRGPLEARVVRVAFERSAQGSVAEARLGETRCVATVSASVTSPFPDRPHEGFLHVSVDMSAMAAPGVDRRKGSGNTPLQTVERIVERSIKDSRALDVEALCIVSGAKVWNVRCAIVVLDDCGSVVDAASLAAMGALLHFRRPEVTVVGEAVTVHALDERAPVPLSVHHVPLCVSVGLQERPSALTRAAPARRNRDEDDGDGDDDADAENDDVAAGSSGILLDPTDREELILAGRATLVLNAHGEACGVYKVGAPGMRPGTLRRCLDIAAAVCSERLRILNEVLVAG